MNRRIFLLLATTPALAAMTALAETFEERWRDRVTGVALRHVPATQPFDEKQFDDEVRKRTLTPPPPKKPSRRRLAHRRLRRRRL